MTRIGGGSNPTNDPAWIDKKLMSGEELTPAEAKINEQQTAELSKTIETLNQNVRKGDMKAAWARVDGLQKQFEALSPDMKDFMYRSLTNKSGLAEKFEYKLSTFNRDRLLKILNPDHQGKPQNADKAKSAKLGQETAHEKNFQSQLQQASLRSAFDQKIGDPGFTPKGGPDQGPGDPGFTPKVKDNLPKDFPFPNNDPGFTPKLKPNKDGLPKDDPGFAPKLNPGTSHPQLPNEDPGFTPKLKPNKEGIPNEDPGFTPKLKPNKDGLPKDDPGFTPKLNPDANRPQLPNEDPGFTPKLKK